MEFHSFHFRKFHSQSFCPPKSKKEYFCPSKVLLSGSETKGQIVAAELKLLNHGYCTLTDTCSSDLNEGQAVTELQHAPLGVTCYPFAPTTPRPLAPSHFALSSPRPFTYSPLYRTPPPEPHVTSSPLHLHLHFSPPPLASSPPLQLLY